MGNHGDISGKPGLAESIFFFSMGNSRFGELKTVDSSFPLRGAVPEVDPRKWDVKFRVPRHVDDALRMADL